MNTSLRILHLEDSPRDAELIHSTLEDEVLDCEVVLCDGGFLDALLFVVGGCS